MDTSRRGSSLSSYYDDNDDPNVVRIPFVGPVARAKAPVSRLALALAASKPHSAPRPVGMSEGGGGGTTGAARAFRGHATRAESGSARRAEAEALVRRLEAVSKAPPLLRSKISTLDGEWHLIYFASGSSRRRLPGLQGVTIRASDADPRARYITQTIFLESMGAVNAAVFSVAGVLCEVSVDAKIKPLDSYTVEVIFSDSAVQHWVAPRRALPPHFVQCQRHASHLVLVATGPRRARWR